jgi:hypothetical protein
MKPDDDGGEDYDVQLFAAALMEEEGLENVPVEEISTQICTRFDLDHPPVEAVRCEQDEHENTQTLPSVVEDKLETVSVDDLPEMLHQCEAFSCETEVTQTLPSMVEDKLEIVSVDDLPEMLHQCETFSCENEGRVEREGDEWFPRIDELEQVEDVIDRDQPEVDGWFPGVVEELARSEAAEMLNEVLRREEEALQDQDEIKLVANDDCSTAEHNDEDSAQNQRRDAEESQVSYQYQFINDAFKTDGAGSADDDKKWIYQNREVIYDSQRILEKVRKRVTSEIDADQKVEDHVVDDEAAADDDDDDDDGEQETPCNIWNGGFYHWSLINDHSSESGLRLVKTEEQDIATQFSSNKKAELVEKNSELFSTSEAASRVVDLLAQYSSLSETDYALDDYACGVDYAEGLQVQRDGDSREDDAKELSGDLTRSEFLSFDEDSLEDIYTRWCHALDAEETDHDAVKDLLLGNEEERRSFVDFVARTKPEHLHVDQETGMTRSARVVALACPGEARRTEVAAVLSANVSWAAVTLTEGLSVSGGVGHSLHICALLQALLSVAQTEVLHIFLQMNLPLLLLSMWHRPGCGDLLLCLLLGCPPEVFPPKACGMIRREVVQYLHGASWKRGIQEALWIHQSNDKPTTEKGELTPVGSHGHGSEYDDDFVATSRDASPKKRQAKAYNDENDSGLNAVEQQLSRLPSPSRRSKKKDEHQKPGTPPRKTTDHELCESPTRPGGSASAVAETPPLSPKCRRQLVTFSGVVEFLCRVLEACSKCSENQRLRDQLFQRALSLLFVENDAIGYVLVSVVSGRCRFNAVSLLYEILKLALTPKGCLSFLAENILQQYFQFISPLSFIIVHTKANSMQSPDEGEGGSSFLRLQTYTIRSPLGATLTTLTQVLSLVVQQYNRDALMMIGPECWIYFVAWFIDHRCNQIFHTACCRIFMTLLNHGEPLLIRHVFEDLGLARSLMMLGISEQCVGTPMTEWRRFPGNPHQASCEEYRYPDDQGSHCSKVTQTNKNSKHPGGMGSCWKVVAALHDMATNGFGLHPSSVNFAAVDGTALRSDDLQEDIELEDAPEAKFSLGPSVFSRKLPHEEVEGCSNMSTREWQAEPQLGLSKLLWSLPYWLQVVDLARNANFGVVERSSHIRATGRSLSADTNKPEEQPPLIGDSQPTHSVKVPEPEAAVETEPDAEGSCEDGDDTKEQATE